MKVIIHLEIEEGGPGIVFQSETPTIVQAIRNIIKPEIYETMEKGKKTNVDDHSERLVRELLEINLIN